MDESPLNPELTPSEEATRSGLSPGAREARPDRAGHRRQVTTEPKRVEILLRIVATDAEQTEPAKPGSTGHWPVTSGDSPDGTPEPLQRKSGAGSDLSVATIPVGGSPTGAGESPALPAADPLQVGNRKSSTLRSTATEDGQIENGPIPARMLNEFVYCERLFYYEFVEGVFVESADTLRGGALHARVDSGTGALPKAAKGSAV